jgi:hypothetical protein
MSLNGFPLCLCGRNVNLMAEIVAFVVPDNDTVKRHSVYLVFGFSEIRHVRNDTKAKTVRVISFAILPLRVIAIIFPESSM